MSMFNNPAIPEGHASTGSASNLRPAPPWIAMRLAVWVAVVLFGMGAPAWAAETKTDPKAEAEAEAAAAMERARRQAASPMRVILQASKVRRKTAVDGDSPVPAAAGPAAARAAAPATTATLPARFNTSSGNGNGSGNAVTDRRLTVQSAAQASVPAETSAVPDVVPLPTAATTAATAAAIFPTSAAAAIAVTTPTQAVSAPVTGSATPPAALDTAEPVVFRPKLLEMVEPSIPQRVLEQVGPLVELNLEVTIRPDGSVAAVSVLQPAPRAMVRYVVAAVERWRFDRSPSEHLHRVRLVFNER